MYDNTKLEGKSQVYGRKRFALKFFFSFAMVAGDSGRGSLMMRWDCAGRKDDIYKCFPRFKGMMGSFESMVDVLRWFLE